MIYIIQNNHDLSEHSQDGKTENINIFMTVVLVVRVIFVAINGEKNLFYYFPSRLRYIIFTGIRNHCWQHVQLSFVHEKTFISVRNATHWVFLNFRICIIHFFYFQGDFMSNFDSAYEGKHVCWHCCVLFSYLRELVS